MKRWAIVLGCVLSLLGCTGDDSEGGAGSAGSGAGTGGSGASAGSAGTGGSSGAGTGGAGTGGAGGMTSVPGSGGNMGPGGSGGSAGTSGTGGSGGTSASGEGGTSGEGNTSGIPCGARLGDTCDAGSFCNYPPSAMCGRADGTGICTEQIEIACPEEYEPVCGCDGETYSNSCFASQAGMSVDHDGECEGVEEGDMFDCVLDGVACFVAVPECEEGKVPSVDGDCFGPCVPIEQCKCSGPDDCPQSEKYTCWMSAQHCGPYTQ